MTCPHPDSCPVPDAGSPEHLRTFVIEAGTSWYNVTRHRSVFNSQGLGDTRFAPLFGASGQPIPRVYLASNPIGALLETALHDIWGLTSVVQRCDLRGRCLRRLTCTSTLTVYDLRDRALDSYGIKRAQLVASPSEHYSCTRRWAQALLGSRPESSGVTGLLWHSRQVETAAAHARPALQTIFRTVEQFPRAAVVYDATAPATRAEDWFEVRIEHEDIGEGDGLDLMIDICVQLGLHVED